MSTMTPTLRLLCGIGISLFVACAPTGTRQNRSTAIDKIVVSPLSVQVSESSQLLTVNSIEVDKPSITSSIRSSASEDSLYVVVREIAEETLSMKVLDAGRSRKGSDRADGILRTEILAMDDLKGSRVGGEPARVAFRIGVYAKDGLRPVWVANYVYSQEAIADNWLKLGDRLGASGTGAGWLTSQEIFRRGVAASLQDFNARRDAQFQTSKAGS